MSQRCHKRNCRTNAVPNRVLCTRFIAPTKIICLSAAQFSSKPENFPAGRTLDWGFLVGNRAWAAVAAPSPHIFAHAPRRVGGPADRDTDLSCRAQGRTDHPTARKFDTKRTIRSGGHPRSASRRQIISVGNCPVPDVNRVRDVRDGSQQTHAPRQISPYRSACRCGRARLIRATPLCESPQSSASHLLISGSERSTPIL